jgi:hypothetical protein
MFDSPQQVLKQAADTVGPAAHLSLLREIGELCSVNGI